MHTSSASLRNDEFVRRLGIKCLYGLVELVMYLAHRCLKGLRSLTPLPLAF